MLSFLALALLAHCVYGVSISSRQTVGAVVPTSVVLDYATLKGLQNATTGILSFRGVPYADPPTGKLRWKAPVFPPSKKLGTISATKFGAGCVRTSQTAVATETSENCLFGNVYVRNTTRVTDNLPVLVWFHGGGFQEGSSHSAPPDLIFKSTAKPLILVTFDYRLGQFGFLGGSQVAADGALNAGLLDQRAALQWVQRYISNFGGDPTQVTLWGQSAGAGSAMFHMMANGGNNQGLFRSVIMESSPLGYAPANTTDYVQGVFDDFAKNAGCSNKSTSTLSCLRGKSSSQLALAGNKTLNGRPATLFVFGPIVDGTFVQSRPTQGFKSGQFARVPILAGSNTNEGANWSAELTDPNANTSMPNANETTVFNFLLGQYPTISQDTVNQALELYPLEDFQGSVSLQAAQMYGDVRYICASGMMTASVLAAGSTAYRYHYNNPHLGSDHHDELLAQFSPPDDSNAADLALFETMREYWSSLVTKGAPSSSTGPSWDPVGSDASDNSDSFGGPRILLQPGNIGMEDIDDTLADRCAFWNSKADEMQI